MRCFTVPPLLLVLLLAASGVNGAASTAATAAAKIHCAPCPVGSYQTNVACTCVWCTNAPSRGGGASLLLSPALSAAWR